MRDIIIAKNVFIYLKEYTNVKERHFIVYVFGVHVFRQTNLVTYIDSVDSWELVILVGQNRETHSIGDSRGLQFFCE